MRSIVFLSCVLIGLATAAVNVASDGSTYVAASVMHTPVGIAYGVSLTEIIEKNLNMYETYTNTAVYSESAMDIIVFPESGTGFLQVPHAFTRAFCEPVPAPGFIEMNCDKWNTTQHIHASWASCMARKYKVDIMINYCENSTEPDPNLGPGQKKSFNVDVGFTKDGALGAKYRKSHITATGPVLSQPAKPDAVVFNSSFGVRFSMFTCYDFWFLEPMRTAMEELGVTDFLFPNEMSSGPPYFAMPEAQAGWSLAHNINLISATSFGTGGAGLYHKGTPVIMNKIRPYGLQNAHSVVIGTLPKISKPQPTFGGGVQRMRENTHHTATKELMKAGAATPANTGVPTTCMYGPPVNGLNFTFNCVEFNPNEASSFSLKVKGSHKGVNAPIECEAAIQTLGKSDKKWYLGAIDAYAPPSIETPSSAVNSMCLIFHCDDNVKSCMSMKPWEGWETDLTIESVIVSGTFGGLFNSSTTSVYPHYGFATGSNTGNTSDFVMQIPSREGVLYRSRVNLNSTVQYTVGTSAFMSGIAKDSFLYSFGIYATAFSGQYKN